MIVFPAYANAFEVYPKEGKAFEHLSPLLAGLKRIEFTLRVDDPLVNQGQMTSDFDEGLEKALLASGAKSSILKLPAHILQELDFVFTYGGRTVAVEIEKANREKILRDVLKCHMYLHSGADFAIVALPKNYPHKHSVWNLFEFGVERFRECKTYNFGTDGNLGRILLLGFTQFDGASHVALSTKTRQSMRKHAARE